MQNKFAFYLTLGHNNGVRIDTKDIMITREFLSGLQFSVMTEFDRQGFMGCESPVSLIAESGDYLVILDGDYCEISDTDGHLVETCENVRELPY